MLRSIDIVLLPSHVILTGLADEHTCTEGGELSESRETTDTNALNGLGIRNPAEACKMHTRTTRPLGSPLSVICVCEHDRGFRFFTALDYIRIFSS
uniref:Secreted protein n=1 Tax=Ascaris lumbricoides TaxID=6252 RepID=A0A0M3HUK5_ASCLU